MYDCGLNKQKTILNTSRSSAFIILHVDEKMKNLEVREEKNLIFPVVACIVYIFLVTKLKEWWFLAIE